MSQDTQTQTKSLSKLLETRNKKEQVERVAALMQAVQAPVIDLVIRYDGRRGQVIQVDSIGGTVGIDDALGILEGGRLFLLSRQQTALKGDPKDGDEPV